MKFLIDICSLCGNHQLVPKVIKNFTLSTQWLKIIQIFGLEERQTSFHCLEIKVHIYLATKLKRTRRRYKKNPL